MTRASLFFSLSQAFYQLLKGCLTGGHYSSIFGYSIHPPNPNFGGSESIGRFRMTTLGILMKSLIFMILLHVSFAPAVFGYIDPGAGSYLFQMLMAGLLSSLFAIKMGWRNFRGYLSQFFSRSRSQDDGHD